MKTYRTLFFLALSLFVCSSPSAAITSGYYYVKSHNGLYLTENRNSHNLICTDRIDGSYLQVWTVSVGRDKSITIQNALTERYVEGSTTLYQQWATTTAPHNFTATESSSIYTFANSDNWGMHCDNSNVVVGYYVSDNKSKWTLEDATVDPTDLRNQQLAFQEATATQLTQFFTSTACTALKSTYASMTDASLRSEMSSLPTSVQDMAIKVKNNSWATYSGWDKTERTFRVADYKAYSSHSRWTSIFGFHHSLGRLSNPTGIWVNAGDIIQVYVGSIPSGQSVALEVAGYGQSSGTQYSLQEGMNALQMISAGNCFVFYEVDNTTNGSTPYKALSGYADVSVHIEGGTVQGYFDQTKGDTDADWTQLTTHLLTDTSNRPSVCLKTDKHVMNLGISRLTSALNGSSLTDMLSVWQDLSTWEDELCGRSDAAGGQTRYGQYCNSLYTVTALPGTNGSPHATNYGTYYYEYSDPLIFNANALLTVADNLWCIAHEQGHNRQAPINMVGTTEMSNNVFSNMAIYKQGRYTSRTASIKDVFSDYIDGISWPERIKRANSNTGNYNAHILHLNWSLYLFFHVNGNDPDFFPRLFDALRADPMTKVSGSSTLTPASTDYLKYYVKCCQVSGYDLTDFFASYGFFMLPPEQATSITYNGVTTNRYQSFRDYADYNLYVTQDMVYAAKAQVAAMSGLKPCNIVFIEDRVSAPLATYDGAPAGMLRTINPDSPVKAFGDVGEMGQYTTFDVTPSAYTFNVDASGHVTTSGSGAVGFIVYDTSGNIIGFYNTTSFTLPVGTGTNVIVKTAAGDGTLTEATKDESIVVSATDFPRTDKWYSFRAQRESSRYIESQGAEAGIVGTSASTISDAMQWRFVARNAAATAFDIVNRDDGSYIDPTSSGQIYTTTTQPASGWTVSAAGDYYIITCSSSQFNQGNSGNDYKLLNWGGGSNTSDGGCLFTISAVADYPTTDATLSTAALEELDGYVISVAPSAANELTTGQWYVMYDRGLTSVIYHHGYLYENVSSHTLYNTLTVPSGSATDACKYLVRLINAGSGKYYIQTGYGNYFGQFSTSTAVPLTASQLQRITIAKIAGTDGHFYLKGESTGVILDANECQSNGDATVVGYGTTVPTAIGGNNDWAFYPVTLQRPVILNVVGDKSYATFYYDTDVQTDGTTKAYYIESASNTSATLTETAYEGRDIPAHTAVVLINEEQATSALLSLTSGLSQEISETDNLLKGTLTSMTLDLSSSSPYYSMGRLNGQIGFYKFNSNGTTSITLGAHKAFLEVPGASNSNGFTLTLDDVTGINEIVNSKSSNSKCYDLWGRKIAAPQKGEIYIVNGKKVIMK